jgi:hypothetical protein
MTRFPGDVRFILWCGITGTVIMLAVLPLKAILVWLGWLN